MQNHCPYLLSGSPLTVERLAGPFGFLTTPPHELDQPACRGGIANHSCNDSELLRGDCHNRSYALYHCTGHLDHMLIAEGIVQHKSGLNVIKATLVRIGAAALTVFVVSQFFADTSQSISLPASLATQAPFLDVLKGWGLDTLQLCGRIFVIIMLVMMALHATQSLGWIKYLVRFFKPLMRVLGLPDQAVMSWVTGAGFGLLYGSAVIMEEAKKGASTREELEHVQVSLGINHSMVEETGLFLALGVNPLYLLMPRLIAAIVAVHTLRSIQYLRGKLLRRESVYGSSGRSAP
jgi:hypothetical protein